MLENQNILKFPNPVEIKKNKYIKIRDEIEKILLITQSKKKISHVSLGLKICVNEFR